MKALGRLSITTAAPRALRQAVTMVAGEPEQVGCTGHRRNFRSNVTFHSIMQGFQT
jgi:hypothetical protein